MPKTREQKELAAHDLAEILKKAKSAVFATYEKLPVKDIEALRRAAKEQGVFYTVAKKTLLRRAMQEAGYALDPKSLEGNFATLLGIDDEIAPAKVVTAFAKEHDSMKIVGGSLERRTLTSAEIKALAMLPSKQELLGTLVRTLQAPVSGFVNVLAGNIRGLATVLSAIKEQKGTV